MSEKTKTSDIRPGDTVRVYQKITASAKSDSTAGEKSGKKEKGAKGHEKQERLQAFEGVVLARKHGEEPGATITVRKEISGVGVERIFPIHSPLIDKIEVLKKGKARRAKLYYLRKATGQRARIKER